MRPLQSLQAGHWFKLICGASYQHIPAIRSLAIAYTLAGADCIDVAADPAIIATVQEALAACSTIDLYSKRESHGPDSRLLTPSQTAQPWLMVSLNDGEDPHFRKAEFSSLACPSDCPKPCETVCPAKAITFGASYSGVLDALCYGCGRCLPICPIDNITARSYVYAPEQVVSMVMQSGVNAIEIHTQIGRIADFKRLWQAIAPYIEQLHLIAISCPDGDGVVDYLWSLYEVLHPRPQALIWQTDGRPMSGDIGDGTTRACVQFGQKILRSGLPGFVQLAGGTNRHTVEKLEELGLLSHEASHFQSKLAGIAYGSYARSILQPILDQLEARGSSRLEAHPDLLQEAVQIARRLVEPLKKSIRGVASTTPMK